MKNLDEGGQVGSPTGPGDGIRATGTTAMDRPRGGRQPVPSAGDRAGSDEVDWQAIALRLKAEMQTYRRRQQQWAQEEARREKSELLRRFLDVVDSLEKALAYLAPDDPVHQGVQLAYDSLLALLLREGVARIFAEGRPFDPKLHDAVATVPVAEGSPDDMRVSEVISEGYRLGDAVLRPAKVVVSRARSHRDARNAGRS